MKVTKVSRHVEIHQVVKVGYKFYRSATPAANAWVEQALKNVVANVSKRYPGDTERYYRAWEWRRQVRLRINKQAKRRYYNMVKGYFQRLFV